MINSSPSKLYPTTVTLNDCDKEPIDIIGKIQNHGFFLACTVQKKKISRISENCHLLFKKASSELLGKSINIILDDEIANELFDNLTKKQIAYKETIINNQNITIIAHRSDNEYVFEFEINTISLDPVEYQIRLMEIIADINKVSSVKEKYECAATLIKEYLGYDRVMIYQFDSQWNGSVVAEKREEHLESWLGLHYPASDIPQQARKLFLKQGIRIINDVFSDPVDIISQETINKPIDLSNSELRSVSPIHIEYLSNMGVVSTLTAAIVSNDSLWGLIACHHYSPKYINYYQRLSCKFLTQTLATSIQLSTTDDVLEKIKTSTIVTNKLLNQISDKKSIPEGLTQFEYSINDLTDSSGAAVYIDNQIYTVGICPSHEEIIKLIKKIRQFTKNNLYHTDNMVGLIEEASSYVEIASGVLCTFIYKSKEDALVWFKPEVIQSVNWAGNPDKTFSNESSEKLSPRKSFQKWSIEQKGKSKAWKDSEISEAVNLQKNVLDIIVEKYDEVKKNLHNKLLIAYEELESFSYSVSHDLRAPLRGIDGFAHILKEEYFESLDDFGKSSIRTIISSVNKMNTLIDDMLEYSGLGKRTIQFKNFSMKMTIEELLPDLQSAYPRVKVVVDENLPSIYADKNNVALLLKNLLENAMKYSSKVENPLVSVGHDEENTFFIKDNGIGFDKKHSKRIFGVFNRLVTDEYPGSGIGLAIAKRVIKQHNGEIWVESEIEKGSTFYFKLNTR